MARWMLVLVEDKSYLAELLGFLQLKYVSKLHSLLHPSLLDHSGSLFYKPTSAIQKQSKLSTDTVAYGFVLRNIDDNKK